VLRCSRSSIPWRLTPVNTQPRVKAGQRASRIISSPGLTARAAVAALGGLRCRRRHAGPTPLGDARYDGQVFITH
jgi:hypothetical protein